MGRSPCCEKVGLKKGPWTPEEDQKLLAYVQEHGHGSWRALPSRAGLERCGKSCRLRWTNYLRPDIKRGKFSLQEEQTIIQLHALLGNRWSAIATHLPKRTDNEIKNYWNTHLKKRLAKMGIDPVTHKPKNDPLVSTNDNGGHSKSAAKLSHLAQWESARLEAEARLVRESKLRSTTLHRSSKTLAPSTVESPSSTLTTFSGERENINLKQQAIEFVGTSSSSNLSQQGMVKEEGDNWKNKSNPSFKAAAMEIEGNHNNNSLLAFTSSTTSLFHDISMSISLYQDHASSSARVSSTEEENIIEAEGFTDLLLNSCAGGGHSLSDNSENNGRGGNDNNNDLYYEDSKDYWNSILSLVDSSPSESPMF